MLTPTQALALAARSQRRAVLDATAFARGLGEPVGFVRRATAGGTVFEAVALDSARSCATVDERGRLRLVDSPGRPPAWDPPAPAAVARPRVRPVTRAALEATLAAAARPRTDR